MNTIEQAREIEGLLRGLMGAWPLPQEGADVIDDLIEQLAQLEREMVAATIRIDNDSMEIATLKGQEPVGCSACSEVHSILDADESKIIRNARDGYPEGREPRELTIAERVIALCVYAADWKRWCIGAQEPFKPDWVNYRQGKADGIAEAQERKPLTHSQRLDMQAAFEPHRNKWNAQSILIDMVEKFHGIKEQP